jgi:CDP-glycerol glycerophosphotransferase
VRIVWNSFHGRFSDNPRALWEGVRDHDGLEHVWLADTAHRDAFPDGVELVDVDGPDAPTVLASADLVVANTHTEVEWDKTGRTRYVQTWHGTPLKRIHRDVLWAPRGRLDRLDRDVARWDLLLSPNRVSTPRLRGAFRYRGEVLESGYPRNDVLTDQRREVVAERMRGDLGVGPDERVVLYAPTWRDDEVLGRSSGPVPLVDMAWVAEQLSEKLGEPTTILVRAHNLVTARAAVAGGDRVRDVSGHPDVRDLLCLADVLVTDYSSVMFDFAVTGRPILHFAYDLDRFTSSIRGLYEPLEDVAAGPVVGTPQELAVELTRVLADTEAHRRRWAQRYAAFRETYCGLEDGSATQRVLDHLGLCSPPRGVV